MLSGKATGSSSGISFSISLLPTAIYHPRSFLSSTTNMFRLCPRHDTPSTYLVVGITREQSLTVSAPDQTDSIWFLRLLALLNIVGLKLVDLALLLKVKDGDGGGGSSAEPVSVGGEDKGVDLISGLERVEVLRLVEIPEHGGTVLTT